MRSLGLFLILLTFHVFAQDERAGDRSAVVIIDMQEDFLVRNVYHRDPSNVKKMEELLSAQVRLIKYAQQKNLPIVFIEYESYGETASRLRDAAGDYREFKTIQKTADGMFDRNNSNKGELTEYLKKNQVGNLIIAGANGGGCVYISIKRALEKNFSVVAYSQGIADLNYPDYFYPYIGAFNFRPNCSSCTFQEVADLESLPDPR